MSKATILVVDDEPTILSVMNNILKPFYRVLAANSGERALKISMSEPRPDLILLDVVMPEKDGYSVISQLKRNPITCDIPIIFVTSKDEDDDEEKGLKLGAADYILKPIKPATMLARVKGQLTIKEAHDFLNNKNIILEAEVTKRLEENQNIQNVSIRALAHLAETRDPETGDHILRTQSYIQVLAKKLKESPRFKSVITEHFIREVTKSAPLHDIGKVGIPDSILLKPGKLTPEEWEIMKTHAEIGARAIENAETDVKQPVEFLDLAKEIAHWHHERWDGTGYPDNLAEDHIPVSARLMAIADVFDALVTQRVYKAPMSFNDARKIIIAEKGSHFDPEISDAFLACFDEFVKIAQKYHSVQI